MLCKNRQTPADRKFNPPCALHGRRSPALPAASVPGRQTASYHGQSVGDDCTMGMKFMDLCAIAGATPIYVKTPAGWRFKLRRHETNPVIGGPGKYPGLRQQS